jgi:CRP-like cAMP-binding protein
MINKILQAPIVQEMRKNHLFKMMDEDQFDQVLKFSKSKNIRQDQIIFQQGFELSHIYYLFNGAIKLSRCTRNGDEKIIEVVHPGRTFAEGVLFVGVPLYPVTATALKDSLVIAIEAKSYIQLLHNSDGLCVKMLGHLSQRLHWMLSELDKQTLHNASFRIVDYFLSQVKGKENIDYELILTVPKRDIASRLSIKPETFSRVLKSLQQKQLINIEDNRIILQNVEELRHMVELEEI